MDGISIYNFTTKLYNEDYVYLQYIYMFSFTKNKIYNHNKREKYYIGEH